MRAKPYIRSIFRAFYSLPSLTFIIIILMTSLAGCNMPSMQSASEPKFSDKNAQMYQMYSDTSADPAQNQLQVRRFIGHLHMTDLEDIFGDIQALPQDENCNYVGGPVVRDDVIWYVTVTPDLVGVNLISIAFDGTRSSAFDLDGDRVVDILDIRLNDLRRISFVTEKLGMDVFKYFVQNQNPFCDSELIRQLHLPELGCNDTGEGLSGGNSGSGVFFSGTNIVDPIEMLCSAYDTGVRANFRAYNPAQGYWTDHTVRQETSGHMVGTQETTDKFDATGDFLGTDRITTYIDVVDPTAAVIVIVEHVNSDGHGTRTTTFHFGDGTSSSETSEFVVAPEDVGEPDFDGERTQPRSPVNAPLVITHSPDEPDPDDREPNDPGDNSSTQGNPGPEGDDSVIAEFCRRRANHQSGIEQALADDPTSMGVSCGDVVDAPSNPNCMFIEWATELDFMSVFDMAGDDGNCDPNGERGCEPAGVHEQISRIRGMTAELWSLDLPSINICPAVICDPSTAVEFQTYTAGQIEFSCAEIPETPTLEPSEENCPPGTYYAPVTNRCIQIQIQQAGGSGDGGGSSGACNLSTSACTSQGLSFDSGSCSCVPIQ